jgi:hypothetical protein
MKIVPAAAGLGVLAIVGLAVYGYFEGVPESDIVYAARAGDLPKVRRLLERDPALVRVKVYPQGYERASQRRDYKTRTGESPWEGKYLIHEAVDNGGENAVALLDMLAAAGADLGVRRKGRTLLHDAAQEGKIDVATWLLDHGADVHAVNDCSDNCGELGWTPLHNAQYFSSSEMSELLLTRGATVDATSAKGRSALHVAAAWQDLGGAFTLCRFGADPARADANGKTPRDQALKPAPRPTGWSKPPDDPAELPDWLKIDGGCAKVAERARRTGVPVPEDDARVVFSEFACARGVRDACAPK